MTTPKARNIRKDEALALWQGVSENQTLRPAPIAYKHEGTTIDEDGIRICGSQDFILSVMSRIKPLLAYENGETRIGNRREKHDMKTENENAPASPALDSTALDYIGTATYCPEDNKLRLYVGRVPREEFLKLRAEGWTTLHKQREAGGGDFVAVWTPGRRDTAIAYAGIIEDEDMGPEERAADRAERFGDYRHKRSDEAGGHADRYDSGPSAHGYQDKARAVRAADRHDQIAGRAVDAWGKAEYWQRRTAGVISHALHVSSPSVRMGRIKELESEIRKCEKSRAEYVETWRRWQECAAMTDAVEQTKRAEYLAGYLHGYDYKHPRPDEVTNSHVREKGSSLCTLLSLERNEYGKSITGAEACAMFFARHGEPAGEGDWLTHYRLRLAYENQMIDAQGGRAAFVEMVAGGWLRGGRRLGSEERQIVKVNKSPATGRVVSVLVCDNRPSSVNHWGNPWPDGVAKVLSHTVEVERMSPDAYRAPTADEIAAFEASQKAAKKAAKASAPAPIPLINPTDNDADRLVAMWNNNRKANHDAKNTYTSESARAMHAAQFKPCEVRRMPQAFYSQHAKGSHARAETRGICSLGRLEERNVYYDYSRQAQRAAERGPKVCEVRTTGFDPVHVIILTDKPQKPLPAAVWEPYFPAPAFALKSETVNA